MAQSLRSDVRAVKRKLDELGDDAPFKSFRCEDDAVTFIVDGKRLNLVYTESDAYPHCGVLAMCESDDSVSAALAELNEQFQDNAPLHRVLAKVAAKLGCSLGMLSLTAGSEAAEASQGEQQHSDEDEEMLSGGGSDDDQDSEEYDDFAGDMEEDKDLLVECAMRLSRWQRHNQQVDEAVTASGVTLSAEQTVAQKRQIFSTQEAFNMLSNELLGIFKKQDPAMYADSVGDDVYEWVVGLGDFKRGSALEKDMSEVQRRYQCGSVQLRLSFLRGLHPFYPPAVEVLRPHLAPPVPAALSSHPMLRLENWDPWRSVTDLLLEIKSFLQEHARVDVEHPRNNVGAYQDSAYTTVERLLAQLEALTGATPQCSREHQQLYSARDGYTRNTASLEALQQTGKRSRPADAADGQQPAAAGTATAKTFWARGTGYGHGRDNSGDTWDAKAAAAAQEVQDAALLRMLGQLAQEVAAVMGGPVAPPQTTSSTEPSTSSATTSQQPATAAARPNTPNHAQRNATTSNKNTRASANSSGGSTNANSQSAGGAGSSAAAASDSAALLQALAASCVPAFISSQLRTASFTDMTSRSRYYLALLRLTRELCRPELQPVLHAQPLDARGTILDAVRTCLSAAQSYIRVAAPVYNSREPDTTGGASTAAVRSLTAAGAAALNDAAIQEAKVGLEIARLVVAICDCATALGPSPATADGGNTASTSAAAGSTGKAPAVPKTRAAIARQQQQATAAATGATASSSSSPSYESVMRRLQIDYAEIASTHKFKSTTTSEATQPKPRMVRIAKELAGLDKDLPLNDSSSVFVRIDDSNVVLWRALITGPEGTPYSGGCFVFDIYFPPTYPTAPPQVLLKTTGGGSVRFNPNLYNCGKVCLSLLGTWTAGKGESWNSGTSTALQVLVSIQSLILVPDPYFNEPGFEASMGTDTGNTHSRQYNENIRQATVARAMIDHLKSPPPEFATVIRNHFALRGESILTEVGNWIEEAKTHGSSSHGATLTSLRDQLRKLLPAATTVRASGS